MKNGKFLYFLLPLLLLAMLFHLGAWGVLETSEARYAEIAREMITTGDWFKPQLLGIYHFDKPLMTYWITAVGMKIFGINAFGARFFLQLAYLLQIILVYSIAKQLFNNRDKAFYAALFYAGLPLVLMSVRNLTTDAFLNTFELLAVWLLLRYYSHRKPVWLYLFFIDLGLALFTKGPVGLIIPLLMVYPLRKIKGISGKKNNIHLIIGIFIMLLIGSSWFFYLMAQSDAFYRFFVDEQLADRMFKASTLHRAKPFWYYFAFFPAATLPAFVLVPAAIRKGYRENNTVMKQITLFWLVIPFLFFSISSSKLILYVLPLSPYVALAAAWFLAESPWKQLKGYYFFYWGFLVLVLLTLIVIFTGRIPGFNLHPNLLIVLFLSAGAGWLIWFFIKKSKERFALLSLFLPLILVPVSTQVFKQTEGNAHGMMPVVHFLKEHHLNQQKIIVWDKRLPSLSFDLQKELYSVYYKDFSLKRHTEFQENDNWKKNLINVNQPDEYAYLQKLVNTPSVFIVQKGKFPENYSSLIQGYQHKATINHWIIYY